MKVLKRFSRQIVSIVAIVLFLFAATYLPARAGLPDPETTCSDNGGTWQDTGPAEGTCTYPDGNALTNNVCGSGYTLVVTYIEGTPDDQECIPVPVSDPEPEPDPVIVRRCESRVDGPNPDPVLVYLCYGYNGYVNFTAGACPEMCLIGFVLPQGAGGNLPSDAMATLYVMLDDTDGSPYNGNYQVCFENTTGGPLAVYRYVSGEWRVLNISSRAMVCAQASGDGAFYLGPPPS